MSEAKACRGKKAHESRALAERHRLRLIRRGAHPSRLDVYECRYCSAPAARRWHVGHNQKGKR